MKKNLSKVVLVVVIMVVAIASFKISGKAASGLAEIYWFSAFGSGVGPGGSAKIEEELSSIGYTAKRYSDTHAYYVRRTMNNDKIFVNVSHGLPGRIICDEDTTVSAKAVSSDNNNYSLAAFFGKDDFNGMKFAYLGSCWSAKTNSTYGNLPSYITGTLGAKSALGFKEKVDNNCATYFEKKLFINLANGKTISQSASSAKSATYINFGDYGKVDSYTIYGASDTKIK